MSSRRQDYIARIRYQNELPPPPCGPKLLKSEIDLSGLLSSSSLSAAVLGRDLLVDVDMELGMPIDLVEIPHAFDPETSLEASEGVELEEADRDLLVEPSSKTSTSRPSSAGAGVSFLRRTEYISSDPMRIKRPTARESRKSTHNPEERVQRIESTFDHAQAPLDTLKHPKKRNVHAVKALPLLPDVKQLDLVYLAVNMTGSASLTKVKPPLSRLQLETAVFNNITVGPEDDSQEWMGLFVPEDDESAEKLLNRLKDTRDTLPASEPPLDPVMFKLVQENDIDFTANENDFDEIAISMGADACYYVPVVGRTSLKRRRIAPLKQQLVKEETIDKLEVGLQEVTAEESIERDSIRSKYDPVTYSSA